MLTVETIGWIRREHFLKGKTIREIAPDLHVSRNTVRKVLRSGETSFEYARDVQPRPKLGRWTAELDDLLAGNATKSAREQLTLIRIFEELHGRGYDGGYDAVRRYARRWAKERGQSTAAAYVRGAYALWTESMEAIQKYGTMIKSPWRYPYNYLLDCRRPEPPTSEKGAPCAVTNSQTPYRWNRCVSSNAPIRSRARTTSLFACAQRR
jgi:transposase